MTLAIDQLAREQPLSFDEFLDRYGGGNRHELIDGEVFDLEHQTIISPTFPNLKLTAEQVLKSGR